MSTIQAITNGFIASTNDYALEAFLAVGFSAEEALNAINSSFADVVADSVNNPVQA